MVEVNDISVVANVGEEFSGCSAWTQATCLSRDIVFPAFVILLNLLFIALWHKLIHHVRPRAGVGSPALQRAKLSSFLFKSDHRSARFQWGRETWNSDMWCIFCSIGALKRGRFSLNQGRTVWQIELPHDRKCSFEGVWAPYYYWTCSSGICKSFCGKDLSLPWAFAVLILPEISFMG